MPDMCRFKVQSESYGWTIQMLFANTILKEWRWIEDNPSFDYQENLFADVLRSLGHVVEEEEAY